MNTPDPVLTTLLEQAARDHERWINGDAGGYALPDDGTILGAVGGYARGCAETAERQAAVAAHWLRGSGVHRHADPLVERRAASKAADLLDVL